MLVVQAGLGHGVKPSTLEREVEKVDDGVMAGSDSATAKAGAAEEVVKPSLQRSFAAATEVRKRDGVDAQTNLGTETKVFVAEDEFRAGGDGREPQ